MERATMPDTNYETSVRKKHGKIFVIIGKSASGKTSLAKDISKDLNITRKLTYTSRIPREGEINGLDYHFVDNEAFENDDFICKEQYFITPIGYQNYGFKRSDLETVENIIIVLTPSGYRELKGKYGERVVGIYVVATRETRFKRYISRDPHDPSVRDEANRRIKADDIDFYDFECEAEYVVKNNADYNTALHEATVAVLVELFHD